MASILLETTFRLSVCLWYSVWCFVIVIWLLQDLIRCPFVFTIYTHPLVINSRQYGIKCYLYTHCCIYYWIRTLTYVSTHPWMLQNTELSTSNKYNHPIYLNDDKTNITHLASKHYVKLALQYSMIFITDNRLIKHLGNIEHVVNCQVWVKI